MRKLSLGIITAILALTIMGGKPVMAQQTRVETCKKITTNLYDGKNPLTVKGEPEFSLMAERFALGEVRNEVKLGLKEQQLLTLVVLTANNTTGDLSSHVTAALKAGATAAEVRESLYQCTPYVGMARVKPALIEMYAAFSKNGIKTPLKNDGTVEENTRYEKGLAVQKSIFGGEHVDKQIVSAPLDQKHINYNLAANCFGDYYTRSTLNIKQRELVTFTAIFSLGGCDPQARAHAKANISVGNTRQDLLDAVTIAQPYIGYPRSLNALAAINAVASAK